MVVARHDELQHTTFSRPMGLVSVGRLPISQNGKGRDHNGNGFTLPMPGGEFEPGYIHGTTNDVDERAESDCVGLKGLFATILHQLGLDHDRLTYERHGREETLIDSVATGPASSTSFWWAHGLVS